MKAIHIRQLEDETVEGLKRRARRNRRSLQKEVETLLNDAAQMVPREGDPLHPVLAGLHTVATDRRCMNESREEIYGDDGR